jgi:hypothetical protein
MSISREFIERPIMTTLVMAALIMFGARSAMRCSGPPERAIYEAAMIHFRL